MHNNQAWIHNINRNWFNMAARQIPKNYRNITGIAASIKSIGDAGFESSLERDFIALIEFSPEVKHFEVQPVQIKWIDSSGKPKRYTPDLLVHYIQDSARPPFLFEVKYRNDLAKNWQSLKPKFKKARAYAKERGWRFKIVTEVEIRTPVLKNARFLLPYTMRGPADEGHMELLDSKLSELGSTTPKQLLRAIYKDEWNQAKLLPTLWYLVLRPSNNYTNLFSNKGDQIAIPNQA